MSCFDLWAPRAYYVSQVVLVIIALAAALITLRQMRSNRLLDLLRYVESNEMRSARRVVIQQIEPIADTSWWSGKDFGGELERSASTVSAAYDILQLMLDRSSRATRKLFLEQWAESIVRTHNALKPFLADRRKLAPGAYANFTRLAEAASKYARLNLPVKGKSN